MYEWNIYAPQSGQPLAISGKQWTWICCKQQSVLVTLESSWEPHTGKSWYFRLFRNTVDAESVFTRFLGTLSAADLLKEQSCRTDLLGLPRASSFFLNSNWNLEGWDKVDAEDGSGTGTAVRVRLESGRRRCIHSFRQKIVNWHEG